MTYWSLLRQQRLLLPPHSAPAVWKKSWSSSEAAVSRAYSISLNGHLWDESASYQKRRHENVLHMAKASQGRVRSHLWVSEPHQSLPGNSRDCALGNAAQVLLWPGALHPALLLLCGSVCPCEAVIILTSRWVLYISWVTQLAIFSLSLFLPCIPQLDEYF